jgi:hypothetical protein
MKSVNLMAVWNDILSFARQAGVILAGIHGRPPREQEIALGDP